MANPYNLDYLKIFIGQQETQRLEFKSARDLLHENSQKRNKFVSEQLVPTVSAFLNTDGGVLVIGVEEKNGEAIGISDGVPRSRMSWEQLQSAICDRIQPSVASYVSTYSVPVTTAANDEKLFVFVIEVKPGTTAYQADDKKYYVRRSGQSEAMEDKDVRLRMLAGDKPKLSVSLSPRLQLTGTGKHASGIFWILRLENTGIRTISRAIIWTSVKFDGLPESGARIITASCREYLETTFSIKGVESTGLFPGQSFAIDHFSLSSLTFHGCEAIDAVRISAQVIVYIDDGLPAELREYDLMADVRPVIDGGWKATEG
jgi:hypothetical protein